MTADDLWEEYRAKCCPGESGEALHWQRMAFLAGVAAAVGSVWNRPACINELADSIDRWVEKWKAERN